MKLFQTAGFGQKYLSAFRLKNPNSLYMSHVEQKQALLGDRYEATHILKPVYEGSKSCFFTVADDSSLQLSWAREKGFIGTNLENILLAQIEEFQPDVLYQLDPILLPSSFVRRLPGCVKKVIAWRAAPLGGADLTAYDLVVSNFETLNGRWREQGLNAAWFSPSWDPEMASYAKNLNRPVDVFFTGSYARTTGHNERLAMLAAVTALTSEYRIDLRLVYKRWGRLADKPIIRWIPVPIRLPRALKKHSVGTPVYGRDMYEMLSQSKILLNPATSIAGNIRGNMRCWEALGCGACMLGSDGKYPEGFEPGVNFESYVSDSDLISKIKGLLVDEDRRKSISAAGAEMLGKVWSKDRQWKDFEMLVSKL